MTGTWLMTSLIVVYVLIAAVFAYEQNWPKMTYWLAAAVLTGSVLCMK